MYRPLRAAGDSCGWGPLGPLLKGVVARLARPGVFFMVQKNPPPFDPKLRALARELRKNGTLGEVLLWKAVKGKSLGVEFHRQAPIGSYIVDFFCHEKMLALQVDGLSHRTDDAAARDIQRQRDLERMGVRFLRFSERDVRQNTADCVRAIREWLEGAAEEERME